MFDLSLAALGLELLLELLRYKLPPDRLWLLFAGLTAGLPGLFLIILAAVWESSRQVAVVLGLALLQSSLPALMICLSAPTILLLARSVSLATSLLHPLQEAAGRADRGLLGPGEDVAPHPRRRRRGDAHLPLPLLHRGRCCLGRPAGFFIQGCELIIENLM